MAKHLDTPCKLEGILRDFSDDKYIKRKPLERFYCSKLIDSEIRSRDNKTGKTRYRVFFVSDLSSASKSFPEQASERRTSAGQSSLSSACQVPVQSLEPLPDKALDKNSSSMQKNTTNPNNYQQIYHREHFEVGDKVVWENCPAHLSTWNPFAMVTIDACWEQKEIEVFSTHRSSSIQSCILGFPSSSYVKL